MTKPLTNPLHLYRSLLRECTYLPDSHAQTYFHRYVVERFRKYLPQIKAYRRKIPFNVQVSLLASGRKKLSLFQRANEGYPKSLEKVLMEAYGRRGKRRRELMTRFTSDESPQTSEDLANYTPIQRYSQQWKPPYKLTLLMRKQRAHQDQLTLVTRTIQVKPRIPDKTIWGKPLATRRRANAVHKWFTQNVDVVLPPLPDHEFSRLRALAYGKEAWSGPIPRRPTARTSSETSTPFPGKALVEGPVKGITFERYARGRPHQLTPRFMRHMWATVLAHTPRVATNEHNRLTVQWERVPKSTAKVVEPGEKEASVLFGDT